MEIIVINTLETLYSRKSVRSFNGYMPECGAPFQRKAIADYYTQNGVMLSADEVFVSSGASYELGDILDLFDRGSAALVIEPAYPAYVSIDGGMGDNPRYILYSSKYSSVVANNALEKPVAPVTIAGKCCESGDLIQENILMPEIKVGDTVAVLATGAYNYSMASNYNRIPRPPIVAIKGNEKKIIVKRETYDDIIKNDLL